MCVTLFKRNTIEVIHEAPFCLKTIDELCLPDNESGDQCLNLCQTFFRLRGCGPTKCILTLHRYLQNGVPQYRLVV